MYTGLGDPDNLMGPNVLHVIVKYINLVLFKRKKARSEKNSKNLKLKRNN